MRIFVEVHRDYHRCLVASGEKEDPSSLLILLEHLVAGTRTIVDWDRVNLHTIIKVLGIESHSAQLSQRKPEPIL